MSLLLFILPKHSVAIWAKITIKSTNFDPINNVRTLFDLKSFNHLVNFSWGVPQLIVNFSKTGDVLILSPIFVLWASQSLIFHAKILFF